MAEPSPVSPSRLETRSRPWPARPSAGLGLGLVLAALLVVVGLTTTGGFDQSITVSGADTWVEIALTLVGAAAVAAAVALAAPGRAWGAVTVGLFVLLAALTAASIVWSVTPDASWQATNLTFAYLMTFAAAAALARLAPARWPVVVGALAVFTSVLCAYALLTKVFPASLAASDTQGRLQAPLGYWNALGSLAGLGLGPVLWAYHRSRAGAVARGLAVPAATVLASVVVLSLSRTAVAAAVVSLALWLIFAPGRLRTVAMLAVAGAGVAVVGGWALAHPALSGDGAALSARDSAGHIFGVVLLVVLVVLAVAGIALARAADRLVVAEATRRRIGWALIGLLGLVPVVVVIALASSSRGLTGEISHAWTSLTSVNSGVSNSASRITQFGSSRPLYWSEGISVGEHALFKGVGALGFATARTRYTTNAHVVGHAHSYLVQTFADLGLLGLLISLALLVAWGRTALRALDAFSPWSELEPPLRAERRGLLALLVAVIGYGLVSAVDWTWYFPSVTVPALLAAGWLAGRGPLGQPVGPARPRRSLLARPVALSATGALTVVALAAAWLIWQPLRSANADSAAISAAAAGHGPAAFADARSAETEDPLALQPRFVLASLYTAAGQPGAARRELTGAVTLQPQNPNSWLQLGLYDLDSAHPGLAFTELARSYRLDPTVPATFDALIQARTATRRTKR